MADMDARMAGRKPTGSERESGAPETGAPQSLEQELRNLYKAYGEGDVPPHLKALAEQIERAASRADEPGDA